MDLPVLISVPMSAMSNKTLKTKNFETRKKCWNRLRDKSELSICIQCYETYERCNLMRRQYKLKCLTETKITEVI
jgi:hypothetical protein